MWCLSAGNQYGADDKVEVLTDSDWEYDAKANTVKLLANHPDTGTTIEIDYETPIVTE